MDGENRSKDFAEGRDLAGGDLNLREGDEQTRPAYYKHK